MSGHQQVTDNINSFNVFTYNNHGNILNFNTEADYEGYQILQWLSPLEPHQRHQGVRIDRLDSVGSWVLEANEFRKWKDAENGCAEPVLFCYGNPGVGKTYLSSLVIDSLCDQARGQDIAVVGLYCDFLAQEEQSTARILGAILRQLVSRGGIPEYIRGAFQKAKNEFGGRSLRLPDLVEFLKKTIKSLPRVFICIDALDESAPKHRRGLFESLREMVRVSPGARLFLTARPHIGDEIVRCFSKAVWLSVSPTQGDIRSYLEMKLDNDTDPNAMDNELRADIMRVIPEKISEIFLLVSLNIDAVLGEVTLHKRRKKLDEMTKGEGLVDAYAATLSRIKTQQRNRSKLGMEVLMWVSHSERPLHVDELRHALGVEGGSIDLNVRDIPAVETLLACSLGLVTVEKSSSTVRLVHYTLHEFLSHHSNLFLKPHSMIAEACLTYLNFRYVKGLSLARWSVPPTVPFVKYASCYWGVHARRGATECVKRLALKLLDGYDKHISSQVLLLNEEGSCGKLIDSDGRPRGFTGLHCAAYLGCEEITAALLQLNEFDVQATDLSGSTAMAWAARRGHEGVVRILLERDDVNPDKTDTQYGRTPLSWAARGGHEGVVRMLLKRNDVNPNTVDTIYRQTPLLLAAQNGHEGVVRILLEWNDLNPDITDTRYGQTPLSWAAENGHAGIVRRLLSRGDIDPNTIDTMYGQTPLLWAAQNGHEGVVKILLERSDLNPGIVDTTYGQTPLSCAAQYGHEGVVKILLGRSDINPNIADTKSGRTPLSWAAENGHEASVRRLLKRNDINPDIADIQYGRTPLWSAVQCGHEGVVRILLERNDVNPNIADTKHGQTPLLWAAQLGHEGVVRVLLERNDVDLNIADYKHGRTPLWLAVQCCHEEVVGMLLECINLNPNIADTKCGQTPLSWAAKNGHEGMVRRLLKRDDISPNTADIQYGRTPLWSAVQRGHEGVVKILLERNDVNPNIADDKHGRTPLSWAAESGHEGMVEILLARSDTNPNTADTGSGRTPLWLAVRRGHEGVVRILLKRNDVDCNIADDKHRLTPLMLAILNRRRKIARLLRGRKG